MLDDVLLDEWESYYHYLPVPCSGKLENVMISLQPSFSHV